MRRVGGVRYTYVKVTGGVLHARDEVQTLSGACKVAAVLAPQGGKLLTMGEAHAGQTVALAGLSAKPGERIGADCGLEAPETVPLMSVQVEPVEPLTQSTLLMAPARAGGRRSAAFRSSKRRRAYPSA